ncbi:hypothetical protein BGZ76_003512, partial [Entomortierella beljakovae]
NTGVTSTTQLLYNTETKVYYVYYRYGDEVTVSEGYETIEAAKDAYQVNYKEKFDVEWTDRETTVSEKWTYEVKTYETFEETVEYDEVIEESEALAIVEREEVVVKEPVIQVETSSVVVEEDVVVEETQKTVVEVEEKTIVKDTVVAAVEEEIIVKDTVVTAVEEETIVKETVVTAVEEETIVEATVEEVVETTAVTDVTEEVIVEKDTVTVPAAPKGPSWFSRAAGAVGSAASSAAHGVGSATEAVAITAAVGVGAAVVGTGALVYGAGHLAHGAVEKVDGVWKHTVQKLSARKAHVDEKCPIAKTAYVYYDDDVYDAVLTDKNTGITSTTQLLYNTETKVYYVYYRYGDEVTVSEGYETVEAAKDAYQVTYKEKFDVDWTQRETAKSERWTYEVKTYETFEEVEEVEEVIDEGSSAAIITREQEVETTTTTTTTTTTQEQEIIVEEPKVTEGEVITKVITTTQETGVVAQPAVSKETSWFRRLASGAGAAASGALKQVDGVWKRTAEVLTTRKAHVDEICPIAKTAYVYYDEDVYDSVLVEKNTGLTHHMQLLYDNDAKAYFVYNRWGEKEVKLNGPYETIEAAKASFLIIYKEWFGIEWNQRETTVSERWTYEVKTYETFEETEIIEETVEDYEVSEIIAKEREIIVDEQTVSTQQSISSTHDDTVVRTATEKVFYQEGKPQEISRTQYETVTRIEGSAGAGAGAGGSSSTTVVEEKKTVFDFASLPQLGDVGINVNTGAAEGVIDLRSGETLRELPTHLRPRAWVSLHVGGWQDSPRELQGFMRLDDQSGQRLMEEARDASSGKAQEATAIDNLRLPEIVALFAQKLYGHFGEELPEELSAERLSLLGPHRR